MTGGYQKEIDKYREGFVGLQGRRDAQYPREMDQKQEVIGDQGDIWYEYNPQSQLRRHLARVMRSRFWTSGTLTSHRGAARGRSIFNFRTRNFFLCASF